LENQSIYSEFVKVFTHFAQLSTDFARIFTKSKVLGVRLHALHPAYSSESECERCFETYVVIFTYIFRCSG